jgi:hypothetical protein
MSRTALRSAMRRLPGVLLVAALVGVGAAGAAAARPRAAAPGVGPRGQGPALLLDSLPDQGPIELLLARRDSLQLSPSQVDALERIAAALRQRNAPLIRQLMVTRRELQPLIGMHPRDMTPAQRQHFMPRTPHGLGPSCRRSGATTCRPWAASAPSSHPSRRCTYASGCWSPAWSTPCHRATTGSAAPAPPWRRRRQRWRRQRWRREPVTVNVATPIVPEERLLIEAVRRGSRPAFDELVRRHMQPAFALAYRILNQREDAEDVVQEAFMAALAAIDSFDEQRAFAPWFSRIVVNRALNVRKRWAARPADRVPGDGIASTRRRPQLSPSRARSASACTAPSTRCPSGSAPSCDCQHSTA